MRFYVLCLAYTALTIFLAAFGGAYACGGLGA